MKPVIVITGNISAGKTTLAQRLAMTLGAVHLDSDRIRIALFGHMLARSRGREFAIMAARLDAAQQAALPVVLSSTGMSYRFQAILDTWRAVITHVHLTCNPSTFQERERLRGDRVAPVPFLAFKNSREVSFAAPPDLTIPTDELIIEEVYRRAYSRVMAPDSAAAAIDPSSRELANFRLE